MDLNQLLQSATATLVPVAWRIAGAIALWIVGRLLISFSVRIVGRALNQQHFDVTMSRYLMKALTVVLNVALVVALLGYFGVETTTFAALVAACGVAIGVAWGGLLANFAAGAFLVFFRPFKVGDAVTVAGVTGSVEAIGLFGTTLNTADNVLTIIGNNRIFSDTIQNYSANPHRRVDLTATINNRVDHREAMALLRDRLARVPNVLSNPAPVVDVLSFTPAGPVLCVRPSCRNEHYWQVYFDTNRLIREAFGEAGYPMPVAPVAVPQS